jgi:hypothetical protein
MVNHPDITTIVPHLVTPGLVALVLLIWAKRRGATWTQVQFSFGVAMFGAFLTASGWVFAAFLSGERLTPFKILLSQVLVGGACGVLVFFGTMPVARDLTNDLAAKSGPKEK